MDLLTGQGKIIYDPYRGGMNTRWWAVVSVDRELTRYYRWWLTRELHLKRLFAPAWDAHVSIVRGEEPDDGAKTLWSRYHLQKVEFQYSPVVRQAGDTTGETDEKGHFWFVDVYCPKLLQIRDELGLQTRYKFHLTVGKVYI